MINSYHIIDGYTMVIPWLYQWCRREIASENYHFLLRSALFEYLDVSYLAMLSKCSCNVSYSHGKVIKEEGARELHVPGEEGNGDAWFGERLALKLRYFPKWPQNGHFSREKMGKGVISYFQTPKGRARLGWFAIGWESTMGVGICVFHVIM